MLKQNYEVDGSKFEVRAANINFKPYILGVKIQELDKVKNLNDIKNINEVQFDKYFLAKLV